MVDGINGMGSSLYGSSGLSGYGSSTSSYGSGYGSGLSSDIYQPSQPKKSHKGLILGLLAAGAGLFLFRKHIPGLSGITSKNGGLFKKL